MNKGELIKFVTSFLEDAFSFYQDEDFIDQYYFEKIISDTTSDLVSELRDKKNIALETDGGADKEVIIFEDFDFVLKLPKVSGKREVEIYQSAKANGFEEYFAATKEILETTIADKLVVVYLQKKINLEGKYQNSYWNNLSKVQEKEINKIFNEIEDYKVVLKDGSTSTIFRDLNIASFLYFLTSEKREKFIDFVFSEKINDLHEGNFIYYPENNKIMIYDYSGYDSSDLYDDEDEYGYGYDEDDYSHIYPSDYRELRVRS